MNAVVEREQQVVASGETQALMHTITQASRDPSVDINKLERLMAMHERIVARDAEKAYNNAMVACQSEMRQVATDADNPQTRSKYATYAKLDSVLRPIYTKHGFALSFGEDVCEKPDTVRVTCDVTHIGGHTKKYHRDIPADGKGAKGGDVMTKTHAAGAAGSYGARYLLKGIFNVAIGEYDNDGNGGMDVDSLAAHLKAIDEAPDAEELKKVFTLAWNVVLALGDKHAMKKVTEHKDSRKKALGAK